MSRRHVLFVVLMAMLLQAVSLGGHWVGRGNAAEALHEVLHWSGIAHHHEHQASVKADDLQGSEEFAREWAQAAPKPHASYHQDQSADSNRHMGMDACLSALGPIPAGIDSPAIHAACTAPAARPETAPADPDLAGPRRPPKSFA